MDLYIARLAPASTPFFPVPFFSSSYAQPIRSLSRLIELEQSPEFPLLPLQISTTGRMSSQHVDDSELQVEQTAGFKVGEKKTIDEYHQLGKAVIWLEPLLFSP